jgi:acetone carboxylase gamma subunit
MTPQLKAKKRSKTQKFKRLKRISEYLEIVEKADKSKMISCMKCDTEFCNPEDNYKKYALVHVRNPNEMKAVTPRDDTLTYYREFICPGCGILLQVEVWCPRLDSEEPLWDICVKV